MMRRRIALAALGLLFALPLAAQQEKGGDFNSASRTAGSGERRAAAQSAVKPALVVPSAWAIPARSRPTLFGTPAAGDAEQEPGRITPKYEFNSGYNYIKFRPGSPFEDFNVHGIMGGGAYNPGKYIGLAVEIGGGRFRRGTGSGNSADGSLFTYLIGPRLNLRRYDRFVPFAELLLGAAHAGPEITGTQSQDAFATALGGGVDVVLSRNIAWRFAQLDYLMTNFSGAGVGGNARQDNLRLSSGLVVRLGTGPKTVPPPPNRPPVASCSVSPSSLYAGSGDAVAVHVNASDPDNDPLNYSYTATGGTIDGNGPDARWNSAGVAAGTYTVTAKVDDGRGGTATCAADIKVETRPNRPPTISCATDKSPIRPGERTGITATASDPDGDPLTYSYTASAGQIQGSGSKVEFDSAGLKPGSYSIQCSVSDGRGGTADATTNVEVQEPPQVKQLEVRLALHSIYFPTDQPTVTRPNGGLLASQQKTLDALASDFKQYLTYKPEAHLILEGHADKRGTPKYNEALSQRRVDRTKNYLIEKGVLAASIETKAFGLLQNLSAEQVKQLLDQDPDIVAADRAKFEKNLETIVLANNRRVDVTLSTTGEQSIRRYPFSAADALNLINRRGEGPKKKAATAPPAKKPKP